MSKAENKVVDPLVKGLEDHPRDELSRENISYYKLLNLRDQLQDLGNEEEEDGDERNRISYLFWLPVLLVIRVVSIGFKVALFPISLVYKIDYAPFWETTLTRRKETAIVTVIVFLIPIAMSLFCFSLILFIFPLTTLPIGLYYFMIWRDKAPELGTREPFARFWKVWRHFANYFPLKLIKTVDLNPEKSYVFCYHPHGIISMGAFGNFATDATGFSKKFPGIDIRLLTLLTNFNIPFSRELILSLGMCGSSRKACDNILKRNNGKGNAIMLVVGGAQESLDAKPGTYRLTLTRKGFVKVALANNSHLVPVLGFGETDIYDTLVDDHNGWERQIQMRLKKMLGFATPLFRGRGIFNYNFGLLPYRRPIFTVVGKPVPFPEDYDPGREVTTELVDQYHKQYVAALLELYEAFKNEWAANRSESLRIIDAKRQKSIKLQNIK